MTFRQAAADQWLRQAKSLSRELERLDKIRVRWQRIYDYALGMSADPNAPRVQGGKAVSVVERVGVMLADYDDQIRFYEEEIIMCARKRMEIERTIRKVKSDTLREILELRYVHLYTMRECADEMHVSIATVKRYRLAALDEIAMIIKLEPF